jgi:hypothetical protein
MRERTLMPAMDAAQLLFVVGGAMVTRPGKAEKQNYFAHCFQFWDVVEIVS